MEAVDVTPLERVARAICEQAGLKPDANITLMQPMRTEGFSPPFIYQTMGHFAPAWRFFIPHAYTAIEAMRVPSAGMMAAGAFQVPSDGLGALTGRNEVGSPLPMWRAMIDAALKESPDAAAPSPSAGDIPGRADA